MDSTLFLGILIQKDLQLALNNLKPSFIHSFINEKEDYLKIIDLNGDRYLGKKLPALTILSSLELIKENIFSLLKQLLPNFPLTQESLLLIAL